MSNLLDRLAAPFNPELVHWRVGATSGDKGIALAYIDARHVMQRLDDVCGPENWQALYDNAGNGKTCCRIGINVYGNIVSIEENGAVIPSEKWVWKSNGAGDTDIESDKGAFSDAFKRAAVLWGIGRYLYDLDSPWVAMNGKKIKESEFIRLRKLLENYDAGERRSLKDDVRDFLSYLDRVRTPKDLADILDEYGATLAMVQKDAPGWWTGVGMAESYVPLKDRIEAKQQSVGDAA